MLRSHYELLDVAPDADVAVIRSAYLHLSRTLHPDMPNGSSALFGMVTEAYEVLRDPQKRANYDLSLARGKRAPSAGPPSPPRSGPQGGPGSSRQNATGAAQPDPTRQRQQSTPADAFAYRARAHGSKRPDDLPRSPSGRVPQWVIDEAQGRTPQHAVPWRGAHPSYVEQQHRRRRSRRWSRGLTSSLLVLAVIGAAAWLQASGTLKPRVGNAVTSRPANWPTPGHEASAHPLGTPAPVAAASDAYRFVTHQSDGSTPVTYDPCRPIHYVIRAQGGPAGGEQIISDAVLATLTTNSIMSVRMYGNDRAETSSKLADYMITSQGFSNTAVNVASGSALGGGADALGGAALSGKENRPTLITNSDTVVGAGVLAFLTAHAPTLTTGHIFGGTGAVSAASQTAMETAAK